MANPNAPGICAGVGEVASNPMNNAESIRQYLNIFTSEDKRTGAAHFQFDWTLADGTPAPFEVVDIFKFSENGKITELKIIYDSAKTRPAFEELNP